jgi:protein-tyrosine phosphatase
MRGTGPSGPLVDLHSHLVPGVDDGAPDLETALTALGALVGEGAVRVITTPHLDASLLLRPAESEAYLGRVDEAFEHLQEAARLRFPQVELGRAHEVKLDHPDVELSDPRLALPGTSVVPVEWPGFQVPPGSGGVLARLRDQGIQPLIVHPERYLGLGSTLGPIREWLDAGAWLLPNYTSLVGRHGARAQEIVYQLLRQGWAHGLATDDHARPSRPLRIREARRWLEGMNGAELWPLLSHDNPARMARGENPLPVPPLSGKPPFRDRLRWALNRGIA